LPRIARASVVVSVPRFLVVIVELGALGLDIAARDQSHDVLDRGRVSPFDPADHELIHDRGQLSAGWNLGTFLAG
jgi:hypothetical protein